MTRAKVLGAVLLIIGLSAAGRPVQAQAEVGADLGLFSAYVWRGVSLTNKPVAQPAVYLTIPAGNASVALGGWANVELGRYDDPLDHFSQSGGVSSFDLSEFDPYAEISFPVGIATLTGGAIGYIYPNDFGATSDINTVELYATAALGVPLSPELTIYYDIDKVDGAYLEGSVSHSQPLGETVSLDLGALAGLSAGQDAEVDADGEPQAEVYNFLDNGLTHLDLSAGIPLTAGAFSITPTVHLLVNGDDATKLTSPSSDGDLKLWGGVSIGWARGLGEGPKEGAE